MQAPHTVKAFLFILSKTTSQNLRQNPSLKSDSGLMNPQSIGLIYLLWLGICVCLDARDISKLPTKNIYAKAKHTIKIFRRTNRFAPQKELIESGKWSSILHLDKGLTLDTSKLTINSALKRFDQMQFRLFNWRYFVKEPYKYELSDKKYKNNPYKSFFKGTPKNHYSYVTVDHQKQSAFYRLNPTTFIKETYTNDPQNRLQPYEQTIYRDFKHDDQTYSMVWKIKFTEFSKNLPQSEHLGLMYPSSNKQRQWENRLLIHKTVTP